MDSALTSPLVPERVVTCRFCGDPLNSILSFGMQPIAQNFFEKETLCYELEPCLCNGCGLVQLAELPPDAVQFTASYAYRSGTSSWMRDHLRRIGNAALNHCGNIRDPFVVEIGCNDGCLLEPLAEAGIRHLGVDPAAEALEQAKAKGVQVRLDRFSCRIAREIHAKHGAADVIVGINVVGHIRDIRDTVAAIDHLLSSNGVFIFEAVYAGNILRNAAFDQFYDEHVYSFSATSAATIFSEGGLTLIDVAYSANQGGSLIYTFARRGARKPAAAIAQILAQEALEGIATQGAWDSFTERCREKRDALGAVLVESARRGERVAGYGATAKSATVINFCGLTHEDLPWVYDTTPTKIGRVLPHSEISIRDADCLYSDPIDCLLLFAWNHRTEIEQRETKFTQKGGQWIHYQPFIHIT